MIEIDEFNESDFQDLLRLLIAYAREIGEGPLSDDGKKRLFGAVKDGRITFFVARDTDTSKLIGMCSLSSAFSTFNDARTMGILEDLYVVPEKRKTGIASMLCSCLLNEAATLDFSSVIVSCSDKDMAMYRHLGFSDAIGHTLSAVIPA